MQVLEKTQEIVNLANEAFDHNDFFKPLSAQQRLQIITKAAVFEKYNNGEYVVKIGDPSDFLFVIIKGTISVLVGEGDEQFEVTRLTVSQMLGEMAVILEDKRTASCMASGELIILKLANVVFKKVLGAIPEASLSMMKILCERLKKASRPPIHRDMTANAAIPPIEVLNLLPLAFMQRHRVVPVKKRDNVLILGYLDHIDDNLKQNLERMIPALTIEPALMDVAFFNKVMQSYSGEMVAKDSTGSGVKNINDLLKRLVQEGGSDLHLSARQKPRWRIDGVIRVISGFNEFSENEVFDLLKPIMRKSSIEGFEKTGDEDFAYSMDEQSRFRINLLRDNNGASAVFRHIPNTIFSLQDLGMPDILRKWAEMPKGLILVTGPTGSGKSTTLAAMIDHINKTRECHILTIEDPIEFVHKSKSSLVNQREVNVHTSSFARALKAALREDPDVVLVGEMRDLETISMAVETANTGHLVLATLHTSTAMSTVNRIVDQYPAESQEQIRTALADNLIGVCCQTLCKKIGGGRVAALEILAMDYGMSNMIREGKTHMLASAMITGQAKGNRILNDDLVRLIKCGKITKEEAKSHTVDLADLSRKISI